MKWLKVAVPDDFDDNLEKVILGIPIEKPDPQLPDIQYQQCNIWRPHYRNVLDKGFLGLIDFMGGDHSVVNAARVSYGTGTRRVSEDRTLIRYLIRNRHLSPIEMVEIMFHVKAPIIVFRQWVRHRMASINEYSARYSVLSDDIYVPDAEVIKPQSTANKQGRSGEMSDNNVSACLLQIEHSYKEDLQAYKYLLGQTKTPNNSLLRRKELIEDFALRQIHHLQNSNPDWLPEKVTEEMIDAKIKEIAAASGLAFTDEDFQDEGLSRELARIVMPLGTYSEMYWKSDLRNIFNFIGLRSDPHAQKEIRDYSDAMLEMIEPIAPICVAAFIDYQLKGKSLSKMEVEASRVLYRMLAETPDSNIDKDIEATMKESGAGAREIREFLDTLKS